MNESSPAPNLNPSPAASTPPAAGRLTPAQAAESLTSTLASDPDMLELVQMFVDEMPGRVEILQDQFNQHNFNDLRRTAHQLKGACGGYGFPSIGAVAGRLEHSLNEVLTRTSETDVDRLRKQVDELVDMCRRVRV